MYWETNISNRRQNDVTKFRAKRWNHDKAGIISRLESHDLMIMHQMVERILKSIIHLKLWQRKMRWGLLVQDSKNKWR